MSVISSGVVRGSLLPLGPVLFAIGDPSRWKILTLMGDGQPKMVSELARALDKPMSTVSKHVAALRNAGLVVAGQAGLYRIPAHFFPEPGKPVVDYGYFVLRLDVVEPD